ncbi:MAG: DUF1801 domain-containing protein [Candidatus Methanofastidiosum sp.]|nr:DUF1801 domain-containing protein [Methanofastidiosum sp.]
MVEASKEISEYINSLPEDKKEIVKALRSIILSIDPSLNESLKWKQPVYSKKGDICYIFPTGGHVNLGFYKAMELKDPKKLLEGTGKNMGHIKIRSLDEIDKEYFWELVSDAISKDKQ